MGYGIQPDIEVKTTLKDYMENNDPVLDKAIENFNEKQRATTTYIANQLLNRS